MCHMYAAYLEDLYEGAQHDSTITLADIDGNSLSKPSRARRQQFIGARLKVLQLAQIGSALLHCHDHLQKRDSIVAQRGVISMHQHVVEEGGHSRDN